MDVQTKGNSVLSRSDAVGSMIQPLTSSDGYAGRAVKREPCLLVLGAET